MKWRSVALDAAIVLVWLFILGDSFYQAVDLPIAFIGMSDKLPDLPHQLMIVAAVLLPLVPCGVTFWQRQNLMEDMPFVSRKMDQWFFEGAYGYFMARLLPIHASIVSSFIIGLVGGWLTLKSSAGVWSLAVCLGSLLFSFYMLATVAISRKHPPVLK